jgi:hypothetical protein
MLLSVPLVYLLSATAPAILYLWGITACAGVRQYEAGHALFFWPLAALIVPHFLQAVKENRYGIRAVWLAWGISLSLCVATGIVLEGRCQGFGSWFTTPSLPRFFSPAMNQKVYAQLAEDEQGFARIVNVTANRPSGEAYVQCRVNSLTDSLVFLQFPFDRYYMDEQAAPAAEAAYREHSRREVRDVYVTVRVKDGDAVLEELYIEGMPIREFLRRKPE